MFLVYCFFEFFEFLKIGYSNFLIEFSLIGLFKNGIMYVKCVVKFLLVEFVFDNDFCGDESVEKGVVGFWFFIISMGYVNGIVRVCFF